MQLADAAVPNAEHRAPPQHRAAWSPRRGILSAVLVVVLASGAGLFAWRASQSPLQLWVFAKQCAGAPDGNVGSIFGLAISSELRGASTITILRVETLSSSGARAPSYWIVPVTNGTGGAGGATTADPPSHWNERIPAAGATFSRSHPANLLVELTPRDGHALLDGLRVTYRTPDGFIHSVSGDAGMEVDTAGRCRATTGPV